MSTGHSNHSSIATRPADETRTEQVKSPDLLVAGTAELRRDTGHLHGNVKRLHRDVQETQLSLDTEALNLVAPRELLDELGEGFAMAWALVARIVGVSPAAVRKWRRGEAVTSPHHRQLAEFVAFARLVTARNPRIDDVGHWLETPAASRADVTRTDLYVDGHRTELLNIASADTTGEAVLDESDPEWRQRAAASRRWQVIEHEDGATSIVEQPSPGV